MGFYKKVMSISALGLCFGTGVAGAQTSPRISVNVGGDYFFVGGYVAENHDSGLRSTEFMDRFRLTVDAKGKSENGLTYGAHLRMTTFGAPVTGEYAFLYANGSFGEIHAGQVSGPSDYYYIGMQSPTDWRLDYLTNLPVAFINNGATGRSSGPQMQGADIPYFKTGFDWPTFGSIENEATKLSYYTPRLYGFQLAVSYTPRNDSYGTNISRFRSDPGGGLATSSFDDLVEAGVSFSNRFDTVKVDAFADVITGQALNGSGGVTYRNLRALHVGGQVGIGGFAVGAGYLNTGKSGISKALQRNVEDTEMVQVGVQYAFGSTVAGVQYQQGRDAGSLTTAGDRTLDMVTVGALYTVAPGLRIGGDYSYFESRSDLPNRNGRGSVVTLQSALSF